MQGFALSGGPTAIPVTARHYRPAVFVQDRPAILRLKNHFVALPPVRPGNLDVMVRGVLDVETHLNRFTEHEDAVGGG